MCGSGNDNNEVSTTSDNDEWWMEAQGMDASQAQVFFLSFCSTSDT